MVSIIITDFLNKINIILRKGEINLEERVKERIRKYGNLQKLLDEKGITAYRLATDLNFSPMTLSDWKNGVSIPKADKLILIADYLGTTVEELLK